MKFLSNVFVMLCITAIYFPIAFLLFPVPETAFGLFAFFAAPIFIALAVAPQIIPEQHNTGTLPEQDFTTRQRLQRLRIIPPEIRAKGLILKNQVSDLQRKV